MVKSKRGELRKISESLLEAVVQSINGVVILHDLSLNVVFVNDAFEPVFEIAKEDALGRSPMEFLPEVDRSHKEAIVERLRKTLTTKTRSSPHEFVYVSPRNNYRHLLAFSIPVNDEKKNVSHVMSIIYDITWQKELEKKAVTAAKLSSIHDMAYSLAHEINNPLTGIKLGLSTLYKSLEKPDNIQVLDCVMKDLNRIQKTVSCFLHEKKDQQVFKAETSGIVKEIIEDVLFHLAGQLDLNAIRVKKRFCREDVPLMLDRDRIHQVLLNVLLNAIQAMTREGTIHIMTRVVAPPGPVENHRRFLRVSVRDTGRGIPAEHSETVFRPFFSLKHGGTGLGLTICKQILSAHQGFLGIQSAAGKGTRVDIHLPVSG